MTQLEETKKALDEFERIISVYCRETGKLFREEEKAVSTIRAALSQSPQGAMTDKELRDWIFQWSQNEGKTPLESDINDLIWTVQKAAPQPETGADIMNALEEFRDEVNRHSRNSSELFSDETTETIIQALTAQLFDRKVDAQTWFDKLREHKAKMPTHDFTPDEFRAWDNERNILMHDLWRAAVKPAPASDDGVK